MTQSEGQLEPISASARPRVLVAANLGPVPGGHRVQALATTKALRDIGLDVSYTTRVDASADGFDIFHSFGVPPLGLRAARRAGSVVVVSPIWWNAAYQLAGPPTSGALRLSRAARVGFSVAREGIWETSRRLIGRVGAEAMSFESADLLLPNSALEAEQIREDLGVTTPMHVVPNAVDTNIFSPSAEGSSRSGVLYVGRLEPHKNQLGLIREMSGSGIPLTIVGPHHPHHLDYTARCRREADENVTFLGRVPDDDLVGLYRKAAVHAMPSWFETTGLSSLEAAATGAAIVTTSRGFASEYFGNLVSYCDPAVNGSIRDAVAKALSSPAPEALRERIVGRYTWEHAARETYAGYLAALRRDAPMTAS